MTKLAFLAAVLEAFVVAWFPSYAAQPKREEKQDIAALLPRLDSNDPDLVEETLESLAKGGESSRAAVPKLLAMLHDEKRTELHEATSDSLRQIGVEKDRIPELVDLLPRLDPDTQHNIVLILTAHKEEAAIAVRTLRDMLRKEASVGKESEHLVSAICICLGAIGPKAAPAVDDLVWLLQNSPKKVKKDAADALGKIGPAARAAQSALILCLRAVGDDEVGWSFAYALYLIGPDASFVNDYAELLGTVDANSRSALVSLLSNVGPPAGKAVTDGVVKDLLDKEGEPSHIFLILDMLRAIGASRDLVSYACKRIMSDPKYGPVARSKATQELLAVSPLDEDSAALLTSWLCGNDTVLSAVAAYALALSGIHQEEALRVLVADASSRQGNQWERVGAINHLGYVGIPTSSVLRVLLEALDDNNPQIVSAAANALVAINSLRGVSPIDILVKQLSHPDPTVRRNMGTLLALLAGRPESVRAVDAIIARMKAERNLPVRRSLALSLGAFGGLVRARGGIDLLREMLHAEDAESRAFAANALGLVGPDAADSVPELRSLVNDRVSFVRYNALWALGQIHAAPEAVLPDLMSQFGSVDQIARTNAEDAVVRYGRDAVGPLRDALRRNQGATIASIASCLGRIGFDAVPAVADLADALESAKGEARDAIAGAMSEIGQALRNSLERQSVGRVESIVNALERAAAEDRAQAETTQRPAAISDSLQEATDNARESLEELYDRFGRPTWYDHLFANPWFMTPFSALVLLGFAGALHTLLRGKIPFSSWVASAIALGGSGVINLTALAEEWHIHVGGFWLSMATFLSLLLVVGIIHAPMFRRLAAVSPLDELARVAICLPTARKRLFAAYLANALEVQIDPGKRARRLGSNKFLPEKYFPIAAVASTGNGEAEWSDPAGQILAEASGGKTNVAISGPGGQGKSALLHEVLRRAKSEFLNDPSKPFPILCGLGAQNVIKAVEMALGKYTLPEKCLQTLLDGRHVLLCFDAAEKDPGLGATLEAFNQTGSDSSVVVLATRSPDILPVYRQWVRVAPRSLTCATVGDFVAFYCTLDGIDVDQFPKALLSHMENSDGTYSPVYVRLAVFATAGKPGSVGEVYDYALQQLMGGPDGAGRIATLADFCVETYWKTGYYNRLPHRHANDDQKQLQREFLQAGILVAAVPGDLSDDPSEVRFFHDSMLSYLTAKGMFSKGMWDSLCESAGHARFLDRVSDGDALPRSELFAMCVHVFGPKRRLHHTLKQQLSNWLGQPVVIRRLSVEDVLRAIPSDVGSTIGSTHILRPVAKVLEGAISACANADGPEGTRSLASLFAGLAPIAWRAIRHLAEKTETDEHGWATPGPRRERILGFVFFRQRGASHGGIGRSATAKSRKPKGFSAWYWRQTSVRRSRSRSKRSSTRPRRRTARHIQCN